MPVSVLKTCCSKMIGSAYETIFFGLPEVFFEFRVDAVCAFCCFYQYKSYRALLNHCILQKFPVNVSLIMADVNTSDFVPLGIFRITVYGSPSEPEWPDEKVIEKHTYNATTPSPPSHHAHLGYL